MATLFISMFGGQNGNVANTPLAATSVTTSATHAESGILAGTYIKVQTDTASYVALGTAPVATATNGTYLGANEVLWLALKPSLDQKLSAITA